MPSPLLTEKKLNSNVLEKQARVNAHTHHAHLAVGAVIVTILPFWCCRQNLGTDAPGMPYFGREVHLNGKEIVSCM